MGLINGAGSWVIVMAILPLLVMCKSRPMQVSSNTTSSPAHDSQNQLSPGSEWAMVAAQSDQQTAASEHNAAPSGKQYTEYNFSHQDGKWIRSWFQCDRTKDVALLLEPVESRMHRYLAFQKIQPFPQIFLELFQQDEVDCGMMRCWWELKPAHESGKTYIVQESHYYNQEDGYWTRNHQIGIGSNKQAAESHMQQCRWFPMLRVALITEMPRQ